MQRFQIKDGDMLRDTISGITYVAQGEVFTKRYMEAKDWEMVDHGMGDLAGSYESALMVLNTITGINGVVRIASWRTHMENLTAISEELRMNTINETEERRIV